AWWTTSRSCPANRTGRWSAGGSLWPKASPNRARPPGERPGAWSILVAAPTRGLVSVRPRGPIPCDTGRTDHAVPGPGRRFDQRRLPLVRDQLPVGDPRGGAPRPRLRVLP